MYQKQSEVGGTVQVLPELSRNQAASQLQPPVTTRTLQKYLEVAAIFLPSFADFQDSETGYLNRFAKLNVWHLPKLQRIREYARSHGMTQLQSAISKQAEYFETGAIDHDYSQASRRNFKRILQETA